MDLPHHRLFVLGAGFSAAAGLPLGPQLLEAVRQQLRSHFQTIADWDGPLEQEIEEWEALYPGETLNLESVLAYSHRKHFLKLLGSKEHFEQGSRSIVAVREAVQKILISATPPSTPSLYRTFAQRLTPQDMVITFNYDTLLEEALDEIEKPYSLTPEWWLRDGPRPRRYVDVLKLHGSIDWYDRHFHIEAMRRYEEERSEVPDRDPLFGPNPTIPKEPLSRGLVETYGSELLSRVFRVPNHRQYFPITGEISSHIVPFLLPPAYDKLLGHDPIRDLWENLHRTLDVFSVIVLIGYSMPQYDSYAYETLGKLFMDYQSGGYQNDWGQRRVPIQIVGLADSPSSLLETVPFLHHHQTRVWHRGFSQESLGWVDWGDGPSLA